MVLFNMMVFLCSLACPVTVLVGALAGKFPVL